MIYGYIRVSSDKQTVENQRFEISNFCNKQNLNIDGWIEETISGTKNYDKRKLGALLKKVGKGDIIICSELSRLGRNLFMIMEILNICMSKDCRVWTIKDNYRLGDDIQSKVLAFAFGLSAEIERNLISQRTKEALAKRKADGVKLGRPKGKKTAAEKHKLHYKESLVVALLAENVSQREIARICKVNRNTLAKFIIHTGRTHQIRATSAFHGYPLLGDDAYRGGKINSSRDFYLHAYSLEFTETPRFNLPQKIICPPDSDFVEFLNKSLIKLPSEL